MNASIVRLFGLFVVLFAALVALTSTWSVFDASALINNPKNQRTLFAEQQIKRGVIRSADGRILAASHKISGDRYRRSYPTKDLFAHPVGYSFTRFGRTGIELSHNADLIGTPNDLLSVFDSVFREKSTGNDLQTTLRTHAQQVAKNALGARRGAVVALDVKTGAVLVMASSPTYDPNNLDLDNHFAAINRMPGGPLLNRPTQALDPPGSTFKTVTATAALDTNTFTPNSVLNGNSPKEISGVPLRNDGNQSFGDITLTNALTHSVNTVWAQVGLRVGRANFEKYMRRFGFYSLPQLDYPASEMVSSGARTNSELLPPTSPSVDIGRLAIGQDKLLVTPMQMATVAQTIANSGVRMRNYLVARVIAPDGRTVRTTKPKAATRVMSNATAQKLTAMMKKVVQEGTGTAAALAGIEVAGKTGTAELNSAGTLNDLWFIGFTPKVAVAVVVEQVQFGQGGTVAAPIAKQVLQAINGS